MHILNFVTSVASSRTNHPPSWNGSRVSISPQESISPQKDKMQRHHSHSRHRHHQSSFRRSFCTRTCQRGFFVFATLLVLAAFYVVPQIRTKLRDPKWTKRDSRLLNFLSSPASTFRSRANQHIVWSPNDLQSRHGISFNGSIASSSELSSNSEHSINSEAITDTASVSQPGTANNTAKTEISTKTNTPNQHTVAICLAGGIREFELSAGSFAQHLFSAYSPADVFVSAPVDHNSHKVLLLMHAAALAGVEGPEGWRVRSLKFLAQQPLDETSIEAQVLQAHGSPNGVQGLLQYFELVEGCARLIQEAEQQRNATYSWVVRTRPDAFWMGPPPRLQDLQPDAYTYPEGSGWSGYNDRLGIARRDIADATLRRLGSLAMLARHLPKRSCNSERCLKAQLGLMKIPTKAVPVPFCTFTKRRYPWPLGSRGTPVFGLGSTAKLSGAKCRPCTPIETGAGALRAMASLSEHMGLPFSTLRLRNGTGNSVDVLGGHFHICDARGPWEEQWESIFDKQVGEVSATIRTSLGNLKPRDCVVALAHFFGTLTSYSGPPPRLLCHSQPLLFGLQKISTSQKEAFLATQLSKVSPGAKFLEALEVLNLDKWDGTSLPLPGNGWGGGEGTGGEQCDPCLLTVQIRGSWEAMGGRKKEVMNQMEEEKWLVVKCVGTWTKQRCLFMQEKETASTV